MKTGRNDPCPCGSGKKYKHCCLSPASAVGAELRELVEREEIDSLEELQAAANALVSRRNRQALDEFHGLSPEQMTRVLNFPFDSPRLFEFAEILPFEPEAPVLTLSRAIAGAASDHGLKATAKGNLPQKLCRDTAHDYFRNLPADDIRHLSRVNREDDFAELHVTRIILQLAGLLRKAKGRFHVTQKYHRLADRADSTRLYPLIFRTYCEQFNWGYWDGYPEIPFIQQSFVFILYLLHRHGDDWRPAEFYQDSFIRAFPTILEEVQPTSWSSAEDHFRRCFTHRAVNLFLPFMGLARVESVPGDEPFARHHRVKKLPLLDAVVQFNI